MNFEEYKKTVFEIMDNLEIQNSPTQYKRAIENLDSNLKEHEKICMTMEIVDKFKKNEPLPMYYLKSNEEPKKEGLFAKLKKVFK